MRNVLLILLGAARIVASTPNIPSAPPDTPLRGGSQMPPKQRRGGMSSSSSSSRRDNLSSSFSLSSSSSSGNNRIWSEAGGSSINESQIKESASQLQRNLRQDIPLHADFVADTRLPTDIGHFRLRAYRIKDQTNQFVGTEPCVIYSANKPPFGTDGSLLEGVPVRVHDQCMTSEVFRSERCDCKEQLKMALEYIQEHGGFVIYLQQEGRGIGIANKVAAYALQDAGYDTVDANTKLGLPEDCRHYGVVPAILADMNVRSIKLMTNNPRKVNRLSSLGVIIEGTVPHVVPKANKYNRRYLETKQNRMSHTNFGRINFTRQHNKNQ